MLQATHEASTMTTLERAEQALGDALPDSTELADRGLYPDDLRAGVKAVLTAIREPDAKMLEAGCEAFDRAMTLADAFTAMIDAALAEGPTD